MVSKVEQFLEKLKENESRFSVISSQREDDKMRSTRLVCSRCNRNDVDRAWWTGRYQF